METDESKLQNDSAANTAFVTAFIEITSSSNEEALFFLESHNWDLDAAVSTFLDNHTAPIDADSVEAINTAPRPRQHSPDFAPSQSPSRSRSSSPPISRAPYELRSTRTRGGTDKKVDNRASGSRTRGSGIRTLSDLNRPAVEGSDSDSDEFQEYYTGGEKSGMLVQDPTKGKSVDAIFDQARQSAVDGPSVPPSGSKSFTGTARLLSGETVPSIPQHPENITHTITFWRNGFSIDDGPLRRLDDPVNAPFLESIRRSECPRELEPADRRTSVHVNLVRKDEDYPEPVKHRHTSFQGVGRTLASGTPNPSESTTAATSPNIAPSPSIGLVVDETLPITSIQLRLADGTRMVSRFNLHHTIRDIRGFIDASRPSGARNYQLQTMGFPPKQLAVLDQSIEQAGIANSVVIQKF